MEHRAPRNLLVLQHIACEHPGSFRASMDARGIRMRQVELDAGEPIPALADFDILLVMGGPMDVWEEAKFPWLLAEKAAIRQWVRAGRPFLGMCLGHQLLADAMGGSVGLMRAPEVGMDEVRLLPDPLFRGLPAPCPCFQWHGAEVQRLPSGARLLGSSPGCAIQALAIGAHAYGLQFHLELTASTAAEWGAVPEYAAALERVKGAGAMAALQEEVAAGLPAIQLSAQRLFANFLDIAETTLAGAGDPTA